jgi:alpha-tubulin suppressor-like RCC1 family protein
VLSKLLTAGAALGAAAVTVLAATTPAFAQGGTTAEHWGAFNKGKTAYDTKLTPTAMDLPAPVEQVASSNSTQYALLTNGQVWAWGIGTSGELGDGGTKNSFTDPVQVAFPPGVTIASLPTDAMPYLSAFAIDTNGNVWAWGYNNGGEFCLGNTHRQLTPVELPFTDVTALAGAGSHATYDAGGTLYACGNNQYGELGDGSTQTSTTPVEVTALAGQTVTSLVASWADSGALLSNGDYYDWGFDDQGELGNGTTFKASDVPVQVSLPGPVAQVAQGGSDDGNGQTLVMLSSGSLYAWGCDSMYQLGDGQTTNEKSPEQIFAPSGVTYQTLASGGSTSYAITTTGAVYAWGANSTGQVGNGQRTPAQTPVEVWPPAGQPGATSISATAADAVIGVAAAG